MMTGAFSMKKEFIRGVSGQNEIKG